MPNADDILQQAAFTSDGIDYRYLKLHPRAITAAAGVVAELGEPFVALLVDADEVSLLLPDEAVADFAARLPGYEASDITFRLITLRNELPATLVGLMARLSQALAEANISILTFGAYTRDHLFVPSAQFDAAMQTLEQLKDGRADDRTL